MVLLRAKTSREVSTVSSVETRSHGGRQRGLWKLVVAKRRESGNYSYRVS